MVRAVIDRGPNSCRGRGATFKPGVLILAGGFWSRFENMIFLALLLQIILLPYGLLRFSFVLRTQIIGSQILIILPTYFLEIGLQFIFEA